MRTVWVAYDKSKLRLPIASADTSKELARIVGVSVSTVRSEAARFLQGGCTKEKGARFAKIEIEEDEDDRAMEAGKMSESEA